MNIWFTSDWHIGHALAANKRGFANRVEHDEEVINSINLKVKKRDKLFVLGDVAMSKINGEATFKRLICQNAELIIGNHDQYQTKWYLQYFTKVHGFKRYDQYWLSHCPMHPQELYNTMNIHGHIHKNTNSPELPYPYFNVNWDFHRGPVHIEDVQKWRRSNV